MSNQKGYLLLFGYNSYHKMMSYNQTLLTVAISDLILSEVLYECTCVETIVYMCGNGNVHVPVIIGLTL